MKKNLLPITNILLTVSLVLFTVLDRCRKKVPDYYSRTEKTIIYDSTKKQIITNTLPVHVTTQTVPVRIETTDTAAIRKVLASYFAVHSYSQVIQDSSIRATIEDQVSENKIIDRRFQYQWLRPVKSIESTTITLPEKKKINLYLGCFVDYRNTFDIGPRISIETKRNLLIGYDYGIKNNSHRLSFQPRIKW
jgi:hypothetical protein